MFTIYIYIYSPGMSSKFDLVTELKQIIKHEASRNMNNGIEVTPLPLYNLIEYLMQNNLFVNTNEFTVAELYKLFAPFYLDGPYDSRMGFYLLKYRPSVCFYVFDVCKEWTMAEIITRVEQGWNKSKTNANMKSN